MPTKKATKPQTKSQPQETKGPGVIASIAEFLKGASSKSPLSKDDIVNKLSKRFPDKEPEKMRATVNVQLPSRIAKGQKIKVHKNDNGYWAS